jgi:hypothetical protein
MTITTSVVHVTRTRVQLISNAPAGGIIYLYNNNEETDRPAYIGGETVEAGTGFPVYGGPTPHPSFSLIVSPVSPVYAVADTGKDCWLSVMVIP